MEERRGGEGEIRKGLLMKEKNVEGGEERKRRKDRGRRGKDRGRRKERR